MSVTLQKSKWYDTQTLTYRTIVMCINEIVQANLLDYKWCIGGVCVPLYHLKCENISVSIFSFLFAAQQYAHHQRLVSRWGSIWKINGGHLSLLLVFVLVMVVMLLWCFFFFCYYAANVRSYFFFSLSYFFFYFQKRNRKKCNIDCLCVSVDSCIRDSFKFDVEH